MQWLAALCGALGAAVAIASCGGGEAPGGPDPAGPSADPALAEASAPFAAADPLPLEDYAGSASCRECHPAEWDEWHRSHHARAEEELDPELVAAAFAPGFEVAHGTRTSRAELGEDGAPRLVTDGAEGSVEPHAAVRAFGVAPLRQFLVPFERGRYQVSELAWDPAEGEWFDVFGDEDRRAGEYGHWTGRGMAWNGMCAACHNTGVVKGYDAERDAFETTVVEMGVSCEACHGPSRAHVEYQRENPDRAASDPNRPFRERPGMLDTCGSCHARRDELTETFLPGDAFLDHYLPVVPDLTDVYHADGQVRDEDFEYVSFLSSRMYTEDVYCLDCHAPHTGKLLAQGNDLCMRCHVDNLDPAEHLFHEPGTPGGNCVDCHMPLTTYMERHPRRDHGFTIPDPLLTKEWGIPNACDRCHADQGHEWQIEALDAHFGEKLERPTRERARTVARARAGDPRAVGALRAMLEDEATAALWRASAVSMLAGFPQEPDAALAVAAAVEDPDPLVRAYAWRYLDPVAAGYVPAVAEALGDLHAEPTRAVRVEALRFVAQLSGYVPGAAELDRALEVPLDRPAGRARMGSLLLTAPPEAGLAEAGLGHLERAVEWDPFSPHLRSEYALALAAAGRGEEAAEQLAEAARFAPADAAIAFNLGLALADVGDREGAARALQRCVDIDSRFPRAWYNLGLLRDELGEPEGALFALEQEERFGPASPDVPQAAAGILRRLGREREADAAQRRAEELRRQAQSGS